MTCRRSSPFPSRGDTARTSTGWPARPPRTPASSSCGRKRDSLLEERVEGRQGLGARVLLLGGALAFLEDEQLAGVGALLVGRRLGLRLAAPVAHRLVVRVTVQAAVQRRTAVRALVAAPRGGRDTEVHDPSASAADVHQAHLARSVSVALRSNAL